MGCETVSHRDQLSWRDRKKGPHDLIKAFKGLESDYKLVDLKKNGGVP